VSETRQATVAGALASDAAARRVSPRRRGRLGRLPLRAAEALAAIAGRARGPIEPIGMARGLLAIASYRLGSARAPIGWPPAAICYRDSHRLTGKRAA
jgi:hypothetical protein